MEQLERQTLIVICGWAESGKTTLAKELERLLKVHRVDIDEVRRAAFGIPHPHPDQSGELMQRDRQEMAGAYELLGHCADINLHWSRSVIITATFSRKSGQDMVRGLMEKYPAATLRMVQCLPLNDPQEEIEHRISREFGSTYLGAVNSYKRYLEAKERYEKIELPHLEIDTSPPNSVEDCVKHALATFCLSFSLKHRNGAPNAARFHKMTAAFLFYERFDK